jgi:hypothetical protein
MVEHLLVRFSDDLVIAKIWIEVARSRNGFSELPAQGKTINDYGVDEGELGVSAHAVCRAQSESSAAE